MACVYAAAWRRRRRGIGLLSESGLDDKAILELRPHDLLSAGVSAGFSLAGLLGPGRDDSFARYAASRSVALLLTVLIAIGIRSRRAIAFLGITMTVVQAFDGVIGALAHDPSKTYGPFAFAVLNALAVGWLLRVQATHPNEPAKS